MRAGPDGLLQTLPEPFPNPFDTLYGSLSGNLARSLRSPFQAPSKPLLWASVPSCGNPAGFNPDATGMRPGTRLAATNVERLLNRRCARWESTVHRGNSFRLSRLASHVAYQVARVATRTPFKAKAVNSNNSMYPIIISIAYPELPPNEWTVSLRRS